MNATATLDAVRFLAHGTNCTRFDLPRDFAFTFIGKHADPESAATVTSNETQDDYPLPVELSSFTAVPDRTGVILRWRTESEAGNLGFYVLRSSDATDPFSRMNAGIIAGAGSSSVPHEYSYIDHSVEEVQRYFYCLEDVDLQGISHTNEVLYVLVPVESPDKYTAGAIRLQQNAPNPFNPGTWIRYEIDSAYPAEIRIFDIKEKLVRAIPPANEEVGSLAPARGSVYWDGRDESGRIVASGIYIYKLRDGDCVESRKMLLMK